MTKFVLEDNFFCKRLHLVISQLLNKIFQQFKELKLCPRLGAPNFGVNSECFAQKLQIRSKTPGFGVTKNYELMVTTKLVKIGRVPNSHTN